MFDLKMKFAGSLFALFLLAASGAAQCVAPPDGMTNWYTGDGNTFDIVGGEHGVLQSGAGYADGQVGQAFNLDGTSEYVRVAHDPDAAFNFTGSFTIDAWINLDTLSAEFSPIVAKWNDIGSNQRGYFLAIENVAGQARLRFDVSRNGLFGGTNSSRVTSSSAIPLDTWVHVAGVYDATVPTLRIYINGQLVATDAARTSIRPEVTSVFLNGQPLRIGAGDLGGNARDFFLGRIDEVELFDRALTETEIMSIYNAGESGKAITVAMDIKPGDDPEGESPINLKSKGKTPVAVLSTETFDATTLDVGSITFAGASVNVKNNGSYHYSYEDVNGDGLLDLVLHFNTQSLQLGESSTEATMNGVTGTGRCVTATGSIKIVPSP